MKFRTIITSRGDNILVDNDMFDELSKWKWRKNSNGYVIRHGKTDGKRTIVLMHRQIMNAPKSLVVDHINGDRSDNRKENLRLCTHAQNLHNGRPHKDSSSQYKGVSFHKRERKWSANIKGNHLGAFDSEQEAALVYNKSAKEMFGEFAWLNNVSDKVSNHADFIQAISRESGQ